VAGAERPARDQLAAPLVCDGIPALDARDDELTELDASFAADPAAAQRSAVGILARVVGGGGIQCAGVGFQSEAGVIAPAQRLVFEDFVRGAEYFV
jgi:hypothetical protein